MCSNSVEVTINTFINPHLFWIFEKDNLAKRAELEAKLEGVDHNVLRTCQLEQYVLVRQTCYKRAIIKDISPNQYYCWLIDYGILHSVDKVYKCPNNLLKVPAMCKQAAMDNVICVEEMLGPTEKVLIESVHFTPGTIHCAKNHIKLASAIFFQCTRELGKIHIGAVNMRANNGDQYDLATLLIKENLLTFNTTKFQKALEVNSKVHDENYLKYVRTISPQCSQELEHEKNNQFSVKSVGRAKTRKSPLAPKSESDDKLHHLQKWVNQVQPIPVANESDDNDSKPRDSLPNASKIDSDPDNVDASDSVSIASPKHVDRIRQLKAKFCKVSNSEPGESDCGSPSSSSESPAKSSHSDAGAKRSWSDFDGGDGMHSTSGVLNLQPAGTRFAAGEKTKTFSAADVNRKKDAGLKDAGGKDVLEVLHAIDPNIVCICSQCKKWANDTAVHSVDVPAKPVISKRLVKAQSLFKSDKDEGELVRVKNFATEMKYKQGVISWDPNVIVHGIIFPKPIHSVIEVSFNAEIHRYMRKFDQVYSIQSFAWPSLLRKMNVCIVNTPKSGKTMSYLLPMCSNLLEQNERYQDLPTNTISPIVVVLCPGTLVADEVYDLADKIMEEVSEKPAIALAAPPMDRACLNQFQKKVDLLITTPKMLINLLNARIITAKRVCHLILEHADVLLDKFQSEMGNLLTLFDAMLTHRNCNYSVQFVAVSERWTLPLEKLLKSLHYTPFVCVGAYLEGALYGRADIQMHFLESHAKKAALCDSLANYYETCRTVVICDNGQQVGDLKEVLEIKGIKGMFVTSAMEKVEVEETEVKWQATIGGKHQVFVCTDQIYNTILSITNAVILIHYTLPSTWTQFSNRFRCFIQNYESPLNTTKKEDWIRCKAHVFLDETCTRQFPKLIQLLDRMGCQLSTKFHEYYLASLKAKENSHIAAKTSLCPKLKSFGVCTNLKCKLRHTLSSALDDTSRLPKNGTIKFQILKIRNVTSFTAKLLECTDLDGEKHDCDKYPNLHGELQVSMTQRDKHGVFDVKLKDRYVYSTSEGIYYRCYVKKVVQQERITKTATVVVVRLIDAGYDCRTSVTDLFEMPEQFMDVPAQAVEVFVANLVPPDSDDQFSAYSKKKVSTLINKALADGNAYCYGHVSLQLGNAFWIKNVHAMEYLPTLNTSATRLNLSRELLRQNLASRDESQLAALYKLCEKCEIKLPVYVKTNVARAVTIKQAMAQWAFLDESIRLEVFLITVETPSLFYVQISKFNDLLLALEVAIQEAVAKPLYPSLSAVHVDHYYLAKDPGSDRFGRVQVKSVDGGVANCFFVDYGDYTKVPTAELKHLRDDFIEKLPFQAIECRLYGVSPLQKDWENSVIDLLESYTFEPETDIFRSLYAATCKTETPLATGSKRYAIVLIDAFTRRHVVVNKHLIDCGHAKEVDDEYIENEYAHPAEDDSPGCESKADQEFEDLEDKELSFEDIERLRLKYTTEEKNTQNNNEETEEGWEFHLNDKEQWLKNLLGIPDNTRRKTNEPTNNDRLPPLRALPSPGYSTPNITWSQNETSITLNIILTDLVDYELYVLRNSSLTFRTCHSETEYRINLQLFDKVKLGQECPGGLLLRVKLIKLQACVWPRLTLGKERVRYIKYDHRAIPDEVEPAKKPILSFGQVLEEGDELPGDNIVQYGSDDSCSDCSVDSNELY